MNTPVWFLPVVAVLCASLAFLSATTPAPVAIRLSDTTLTCTVPRDASNRLLSYGVADYYLSEQPLEGLNSRITFQAALPKLPCEGDDVYPVLAFCSVTRQSGQSFLATMRRHCDL